MNLLVLKSARALVARGNARCRPGLRYGIAPERKATKKLGTRLDYVVRSTIEQLSRYRQIRLADQHQYELSNHIAELREMTREAQNSELLVLRRRMNSEGSDRDLMLKILAHACIISEYSLMLVPREGQRRAATALLMGYFVEMPTGEGKTLSIALAAGVIASGGIPVHILTANDYLAERDAMRLLPLYDAMGLSSCSILHSMDDDTRRKMYCSDVAYLTGKQSGFDWMRDALVKGPDSSNLVSRLGSLTAPKERLSAKLIQRGLCAAILDEADSMLLDEARTPLVLAATLSQVDSKTQEGSIALALAQMLVKGDDFQLETDARRATITEAGKDRINQLSEGVPGVWRASRYRNERVQQALTALHLWTLDRDYIVRNNEIVLVDEQTGRALADRRLQHGLHGLLELKERCVPTPDNETIASIAFQSFFLRYMTLIGTSATLAEVKGEIARVYESSLIQIMAACESKLLVLPARVFRSRAEQLDALVDEVRRTIASNRPILIGTRSVQQSNGVSATLRAYSIDHTVLDASQNVDEANIVSQAGVAGQVTVATNMAGRGTDIPLGNGVAVQGGLHLVSVAFNDERRIDRQLIGRTARQGDPGSFRQLWTLDDTDFCAAVPASLLAISRYLLKKKNTNRISHNIVLTLFRFAQYRLEIRYRVQRQRALSTRIRIANHVALDGNSEHPV